MSVDTIRIGSKMIGDGYPVYVIAEIGINHNGDINLAKKFIETIEVHINTQFSKNATVTKK